MLTKCIHCGKRIWGESAPVYVYATNSKGEKEELVFHLHTTCYDDIAQNVNVAGTVPMDERLIDENAVDDGEEEDSL